MTQAELTTEEVIDADDSEPTTGSRMSRLFVRTFAEIVFGVAFGALVLWVLIVSVNDIEFVYQGF